MRGWGRRTSTAAAGLACLSGVLALAAAPRYVLFFTDTDPLSGFKAYYDADNISTDGSGNKLVHFKFAEFHEGARSQMEQLCPGSANAEYALGSYTVDCSAKTIGLHPLTSYDSNGKLLAKCDLGGTLDANRPLRQQLMQQVCGS